MLESTVVQEYSYVYNGGTLMQMAIETTVDDGTPVTETLSFSYDASGIPMSVIYNGTAYYYTVNLQGDVMAIVDASGTSVVSYAYDAWGNILSVTGSMAETLGESNPLLYRGYVYDNETKLYYLQSRYYDPEVGRFINADAFTSTGQGILGNNMFAYCNNNPIVFSDATGCKPLVIIPLWTYRTIHTLVQQEVALYYGMDMELYVEYYDENKYKNRRGRLDLYDPEKHQYYEVKSRGAAYTTDTENQMRNYDCSTITDMRGDWFAYSSTNPKRGTNSTISGSFDYSIYSVTYQWEANGLIVYDVDYNPDAITARALVLLGVVACVATPYLGAVGAGLGMAMACMAA